ncbi:hypothetical protein NUW54_g2012 [Trametes sanguinea]|uniref:Uncharacterized protein n=1 Tax=Trametes sanguinea TaxID=158606 RepID=A0ACC1Q508_9APHY|nr:hypothetical protein NUW54_g2012 [Trametes sanguinea]
MPRQLDVAWKELDNRRNTIAELHNKIAARDKALDRISIEFRELRKRMQDLKDEIKRRERYENELRYREEDILRYEEALSQREEELSRRAEELSRREEELSRREEELSRREEELSRREEELSRREAAFERRRSAATEGRAVETEERGADDEERHLPVDERQGNHHSGDRLVERKSRARKAAPPVPSLDLVSIGDTPGADSHRSDHASFNEGANDTHLDTHLTRVESHLPVADVNDNTRGTQDASSHCSETPLSALSILQLRDVSLDMPRRHVAPLLDQSLLSLITDI